MMDNHSDAASTEPAIDTATLAHYLGNDPAMQRRFLARFAEKAADDVEAIGAAAQTSDWQSTAAFAHKLKSSARAVGALRLAGLCADLEALGSEPDAGVAAPLAAQVQREFERVCRFAREFSPS